MESSRPIERAVAAYSFEEGSGTIANDTHVWVKGVSESALSFDGVDDYVNVTEDDALNVNEISVLVWIKYNSPGIGAVDKTQAIIQHLDRGAVCASNGYFLAIGHRASFSEELYLVSGSQGVNPGDFRVCCVSPDTWHQVGFVWESLDASTSRQKLIIDGEVKAERDLNIPVPSARTSKLLLGRITECWGTQRFNGTIDNVQIYDKAIA